MTARQPTERRFGEFELLHRVGRDGPFHLFRARQSGLDRPVTLKVLPERVATLEWTALLRREAETANRLDHPGALHVFEVDAVGGNSYVAMAHVDGELLSEKLRSNPLAPRAALDLTRQLADVVAHAHERGVIHGSLRPEAVWLTREGQVRVSGFGCPIQFEQIDPEVVEGFVGYLAPEQAGGRGAVGKPTDIYSLGALLYAMVTGRPPHEGAGIAETMRLIRSRRPARPSLFRPGLSPIVDDICLKCMHPMPSRRYGSDRPLIRLAADLRRARSGREDREPGHEFARWLERRGRPVATVLAAALLALAPAWWESTRQTSAWTTLTVAGQSPDDYASAVRWFEEKAAVEPHDPEIAAGLALARYRTGRAVDRVAVDLGMPKNIDVWTAVRKMTQMLLAHRAGRRAEARHAFHAAVRSGYAPQSENEQQLYNECIQTFSLP